MQTLYPSNGIGGVATKLLCLSILPLMTACASLKEPEQVPPTQQNLLTKCPELSKHEGTTGAMVLSTMLRWAAEYNDCATRHNGLVDAVIQKEK